jgi:glycosyltransferase involved in cell wall biosynthesis
MRILIVSQFFWPENFRVNDLSAGLVQRGHQVTILTGIPNYPEGKFYSGYNFFKNTRQNYCGAQVIRVPLIPRGKGGNLNLVLNYLSFVIFGTLLAPFVCREKYDVVFVFGGSPILMAIPAIFLKKIKKIPLILYVLDLWPESISAVDAVKSPFFLNAVKKVVQFIYKHCDQILVPSTSFVGRIKEMGINESKINYWPQWAEDNYKIVAVKENSAESREMPTGFRIMFAGNIGAAQGFKTIIEAAEKLKNHLNIHWIIIGDGRMKPWVEDQVRLRKLENTVHLLGRRPIETMSSYFALADVLLVSLKKDPIFALTLPAKIQSYMACGRPVLACLDGEGARLIQESGAGISCPADDYELLAESVLKMNNLPDAERRKMGLRGRAYFEKHFTRDILLSQFVKWIRERLIK